MKIALSKTVDTASLKLQLQHAFPEYTVKTAFLNKKTIRITNGMDQVVVGQLKDNNMICVGNLNMLDPRILIPFVLGIALFFITGLIFIIVMMQIRKISYKIMQAEVASFLTDKLDS